MKKITALTILCTLFSIVLHAQSGVQISYFKPTGKMSYMLKPTVGLEISQGFTFPDEDGRLMLFGSIGFMKFNPTADTFRTVTYTNESNRGYIIPSEQVINMFLVIPISLSAEVKILNTDLTPVAGLDATFYLIMYDGYSHTPGIISSTVEGEELWQTGITPKIGLSYLHDDWFFSASIGKAYGWMGTADRLTFVKSSLRIAKVF